VPLAALDAALLNTLWVMDASAVADILAALDRTVDAGPARISVSFAFRSLDLPPHPRRRRGGLLRPLIRLVKAVAKQFGRQAVGRFTRSLSGQGVIDLRERRYLLEEGSSVWLFDGQRLWVGRSRQRLAEVPESSTPGVFYPFSPLWALDLLRGLTDAMSEATEGVRGVNCGRFQGRADLGRASALRPEGLGAPSADRFEELLALPVTVWLDGHHVRRVRVEAEAAVHTVELFDIGTATADWSHMPSPA
jgi:hypothetical protein